MKNSFYRETEREWPSRRLTSYHALLFSNDAVRSSNGNIRMTNIHPKLRKIQSLAHSS